MADRLALTRPTRVNGFDLTKITFPRKLYDMVSNPETDESIYWAPDGESFFVSDPESFSRELLPRSFKHKNFASFVRQLNMYGFHKIPQLHQGVLKNETETELCQFMNPYFQRGKPDLASTIQRKKSAPGGASGEAGEDEGASSGATGSSGNAEGIAIGPVVLQSITSELGAIKRHQTTITSDLKELQESNQRLWHESFKSRDRQQQLQDTINKILKFLAGVFGKSAGAAGSTTQTADVPINGGFAVMPRKKARLMIDDGKGKEREVVVNSSEMDEIAEINLPGMNEDSDMLSVDGAHLSEAAYSPMDATFFASQTDSGQTRPPPAPDGVRSTSSTPVPPTSTNANPPELPREKHEPTRATAQPPTTSSDLESLASTSSNIPSLSYPSALHPSDFMTSTTPLTPMSAAPTSSSASPHEPSSSTALTSTSPPGSPAPGSMDDPALQAALLNILLSSASGRQRILDVFTPQVTTQLSPPDPTPQPPIPQQFQPPPANNMAPHFFPDINPSSYLPDPQSQITPSPQPPLDSSLNSLWNMFGAFGAGAQLDPSFTNMDTTSHVNSLTQSNAQLQRTFQSAAEVDNRINTLQSYLEGYVPNSGIPDASLPSEFDASNFFDSFGAGELDAHLDAQQLGDAFDLGPEVADEDQSTTPTSHLGAYVDEVGSASATSSPKVPSVNWNDPIIEKEVDPDWVAGGAGVAAAGGGGGGQKRKPGANGTTDESTGGVPPEPPKKKTKSKKKS